MTTTEVLPTRFISAFRPVSERERRAPVTPESVKRLIAAGWKCKLPADIGVASGWTDDEFRAAGARIEPDPDPANADVMLCVEPPPVESIQSLKPGCLLIGLLRPFDANLTFEAAREARVAAIAMELIPRSTLAQSMDALSSQASLAGYSAVIRAASRLSRILPMMSTPAGTIPPARVLVIGTGVAGLQAIATAVRLGARVTAYDVRPAAKEQVESLGAKFARVDVDPVQESSNGYAAAMSESALARQRAALARLCHNSDIVIAAAQVFGKPAPLIIDSSMIAGMQAGAVIVDLAIATGGNVENARDGMDEIIDGVIVLADSDLPSTVARDASNMLASNFASLLDHITDQSGALKPPGHNEILNAVLVTHDGRTRHTLQTPIQARENAAT
ncbi:MAG: hypothetical protein KDA16_09000 [Phycisphaerales bacterium]|nr:hypothetical protein [Phycisphaerales bacterium]